MKCTARNFVGSLFLLLCFVILSDASGLAEQLVLEPAKDNTIWEDQSGSLSNGSGVAFFSGKTGQNRITRALMAFDLSTIPAGSTINSATLELNQSNTNNNAGSSQSLTLQLVLKNWGEGSSNAGSGEGGGASASSGDATWLHTFFNTDLWDTAGGDFSSGVSATTQVGGNGKYTWDSSAQLIADVQGWIDNPASNFGWILRGNESSSRTAKRFDSRSSGNTSNRPRLTIDFDTAPPQFTSKLFFAQFADGSGLSSEITLVNLSATEMVTGNIEILGDTGAPLTVDLNGEDVMGEQSFTVPAGGAALFATDGAGALQAGAVIVSSDQPLAGVVLFAGEGLGVAGVGSSPAVSGFIAPVEMDVPNGILTGVAIMNLESTAQTLQVELSDLTGAPVATGTLGTNPLAGNGHVARFLNDPEFQLSGSPDLSVFRGVLKVTVSSGQIAGTVIRASPGEFATLPVTESP